MGDEENGGQTGRFTGFPSPRLARAGGLLGEAARLSVGRQKELPSIAPLRYVVRYLRHHHPS